jgi:hypothetical protein
MADDLDVLETREWLDALDSVSEFEGPDRATFLVGSLIGGARREGEPVPLLGEHAVSEHDPAGQAGAALTIHPHASPSEAIAMAAEAFEGTITDRYMPRKR